MAPPIKYARSGDIRIAYQVVGDGPVDLILNWTIRSLDLAWENPHYARAFRELAEFTRLIIVNERGLGISDRPALLEAHEERMDDFPTSRSLAPVGSSGPVVLGRRSVAQPAFGHRSPGSLAPLRLVRA